MPLTKIELEGLGAKPHERGGLVIETPNFMAVFLLNPDDDGSRTSWHMRVAPEPKRNGAVNLVVSSVGEVLRGLHYAGRTVGQEDIRHKFRFLMDVAVSDESEAGGLVGGECPEEPK